MTSPLHWYEAVWNVNRSNPPKSDNQPDTTSSLFWLESAWKLGPTADLGEADSPRFTQTLEAGWQRLVSFLTASAEPRIWQSRHSESSAWNAYDPQTGRTIRGVSEAELRSWLEKRYNQSRIPH